MLLQDVLLQRQQMWFTHDGAPAHFSIQVHECLNGASHNRWIVRGEPYSWQVSALKQIILYISFNILFHFVYSNEQEIRNRVKPS